MAASSTDDRDAPQRAQQQQQQPQQDAGQRVPESAGKSGTPAPGQPQAGRARYFAPGEDGECH